MNPIRAWNVFWFRPTSARPLGAFRVAFGLIMLWHLATLWPDLDYWYTDAGLLRGTEAREVAGLLRFSPLHYYQSPATVHAVYAATAAVAALVAIGWRSRIMSILLYAGLLSLHHRNLTSNSGADNLVVILAFLLMLCPGGAAYSLDARRAARRRGTEAEPLILPWSQRLIQIQIVLIYFMAAFTKAGGKPWIEGTALHQILLNGEVRRFHFGLPAYPLAIEVLTHGAILLEFSLAFLLWVRAARPWVMLGGLALHGGIALTINIPVFGELMVASYFTFLAPDELDGLLRRIDPRNWVRRSLPAVPAATIPERVDGPSPRQGPHRPEASPRPAREMSEVGDWEV